MAFLDDLKVRNAVGFPFLFLAKTDKKQTKNRRKELGIGWLKWYNENVIFHTFHAVSSQ